MTCTICKDEIYYGDDILVHIDADDRMLEFAHKECLRQSEVTEDWHELG